MDAGVEVKGVLTKKVEGESARGRSRQVEGVLCEVSKGPQPQVTGRLPRCRIRIIAPVVVSSGGAIHSPALLLHSGITVNGNVGSNLHLHPATAVLATFPSEVPAHPSSLGGPNGSSRLLHPR